MMDEDYFLQPKTYEIDCKKHGKQDTYFKLGHRYFCPHCLGDHLEKTIGQAVVK
jgi:hypothetical protein